MFHPQIKSSSNSNRHQVPLQSGKLGALTCGISGCGTEPLGKSYLAARPA
jgi:hypothetical protein